MVLAAQIQAMVVVAKTETMVAMEDQAYLFYPFLLRTILVQLLVAQQ